MSNFHIHYTVGNEKRVTSLRKMALALDAIDAIRAEVHLPTPSLERVFAERELDDLKKAIAQENAEIAAHQRPPKKLEKTK